MWTQPQETWGHGEKFLVFHHRRRQLTRPLMIHKQNGFQELLWRLLGEKPRTVLCLDDRFLVTARMEARQWKHGTKSCKGQKMSRNTPEKGLWEDDHCDFHQLSMLYHVRRGMNSCGLPKRDCCNPHGWKKQGPVWFQSMEHIWNFVFVFTSVSLLLHALIISHRLLPFLHLYW